jgi:FixJ family two-component response regulator
LRTLSRTTAGSEALSDLIHIVDDDALFRKATGRLLRLHGYDIAEYESADRFLEKVGDGGGSGCILLDVRMPGLSGPDLQRRLADLDCSLPVVFLTGHGDFPTTVRAIKAGAEDFLIKPVSRRALLDSVERAIERQKAELAKAGRLKDARMLLDTLTPRERQVFEFVVRGKLNKQTAHILGIAERTIKEHRKRIFEKLSARSIADLVSLAERLGVLSDDAEAAFSGELSHLAEKP